MVVVVVEAQVIPGPNCGALLGAMACSKYSSASGSKRSKTESVVLLTEGLSAADIIKSRVAREELTLRTEDTEVYLGGTNYSSSDDDDSHKKCKTEGSSMVSRRSENRNKHHRAKRDKRAYKHAMKCWDARTDEEKRSGRFTEPVAPESLRQEQRDAADAEILRVWRPARHFWAVRPHAWVLPASIGERRQQAGRHDAF